MLHINFNQEDMSLNFSLPNKEEKIFLHAIDQQFEKNNRSRDNSPNKHFCDFHKVSLLNDSNPDSHFNVNVKFILSLDDDENFIDLSTEECSETDDFHKENFRDSSLPSEKPKIFDFLINIDECELKSEINKIKADTLKNFRNFQIQMQNKMLMMKQYYDNVYKLKYMDMVKTINVNANNNNSNK